MQKDQAYHEAAIDYNEGLAEFAESLAPKLKHDEVQRWCIAVGKQHRFHAKRHRSALNKILAKQPPGIVENIVDGMDVPKPSEPKAEPPSPAAEDLVTEIFSGEVEANTVEPELPPVPTFEDGCVKFHTPTDPNCKFNPTNGGNNA